VSDHGPGAVRDALPSDALRCAQIYAPYVRDTAISFETDPPSEGEMARRIGAAQHDHAWLVLEQAGTVTGYAYGGPFMSRAAYRWSATVSVYLDGARRRSGGGRALYEALFERLADRGIRTVLAGIALPNEASEGLHRGSVSSRPAPTGGSAGNTAAGTTSPGSSDISSTTTRHPSHCAEQSGGQCWAMVGHGGPWWAIHGGPWCAGGRRSSSVGPRHPPAGQEGGPPVAGSPAASHAWNPPMTSVARCRPRERRASAARLEV
jgi:L-amino acid N-acyltransferase YncA